MKVRVDTHGEFLTLFTDVPIRTPVVIEMTEKQYKILKSISQANGWTVELVVDKPKKKSKDKEKE